MKTKWYLFIFWGVLLLGLLNSAEKTHESPVTRSKKVSTPDSDKAKANRRQDNRASGRRPPPHMRPGVKLQSDFGHLPDVSVSCSASHFVVRVKPAFYGRGADAEELRLGRSCRSNGVLEPYGDLLFTYPLTACDGVRELPHGYLVYKFALHYEPSLKRSGAHGLSVDVECHYPRDHHVHQLAVQPTWDTAVVRKRLKGRQNDFEITLMDVYMLGRFTVYNVDNYKPKSLKAVKKRLALKCHPKRTRGRTQDLSSTQDLWTSPVKSRVYQLGETINVQVSAPRLPPGGKLYISNCYATPSRGPKPSLKYSIIDDLGCMLDSRREPGASQFISRTHKTLRLSLKAFQFTTDPDTEVNIICKLFLASGDPDPEHKSCTYKDNRWIALTGDDSICECCEWHCANSKTQRALMEGSASSMPLLISDQPSLTEDGFLPIDMKREDQELNHDFNEQQSHEKLWKNTDDDDEERQQLEEGRVKLGATTGPDLFDDFTFMEGGFKAWWDDYEVGDLEEFVEEGSASEELNYSQSNEEAFESETFHPWVILKSTQRGGRSEGTEGTVSPEAQWKNDSSPVDNQEKTWYFTWR